MIEQALAKIESILRGFVSCGDSPVNRRRHILRVSYLPVPYGCVAFEVLAHFLG